MDEVTARPRWAAAAEIAAFYALAMGVIWAGERWKPALWPMAAAMIGLCVASNRWHGDSRERVGLDGKHFWPAFRLAALVTVPIVVPLLIVGYGKRFYWPWDLAFVTAGYPVWGFVQEYALLGFALNRLEDALPGQEALHPWINGFLFSMAHLPNPVLMLATFVAGVVFSRIFRRHRHLVPIALAHAAVGVGISMAFADVNGIMAVGPGYWQRVGELPLRF